MAHFNLEFPRDVAAGCTATIERRDEIVELASGYEESNQRWARSRRSWSAGLAIRSADDLAQVIALFEEVRGRANSFHFRDWQDWRSGLPSAPVTPLDQPLGTGDGVAVSFQLVKVYGAVNPYSRAVVLPHAVSVRVAVNGVEALTGWTLSASGGQVVFAVPPAPGAVLRAGFTYDTPVRFLEASLSTSWAYFSDTGAGVGEAPDVSLIEVRLA